MNYWYVARDNELFIDMDNVKRSLPHARSRLQGAIEYKRLDVVSVESNRSTRNGHAHFIVTLRSPIPSIQRYVWEIILHSDLYRGCCNIMRFVHCVRAPNVLISPCRTFGNRKSDYGCNCKGKHTASVMNKCPVAISLRGKERTRGFFGKPSKNPCEVWKCIS